MFLLNLIDNLLLLIYKIITIPFTKNILYIFPVIIFSLIVYVLIYGKLIPSKIPFDEVASSYDLKEKSLKSIMIAESNANFMVINVNDKGLVGKALKGGKSFDYEVSAYLYMESFLELLNQNYDVGPFQINSIWFKSIKYSKIELMNPFNSIYVSAKILSNNKKSCRKKGFSNRDLDLCAYSMYNTGKSHNQSSIGKKYAQKIMKIKKNLHQHEEKLNKRIIYIPLYGYLKI